jgi:hypothetical protein
MARTASHHPWRVTLVGGGKCEVPGCTGCDEHEPWKAFAYTNGLHEAFGIAELYMTAQPQPCSEMPVMQALDLGRVIDRIAHEYSAGVYKPGEGIVVHGWPGGFAVTVTIGTFPVDRDAAECYLAHPDARVLQLTWCGHPR